MAVAKKNKFSKPSLPELCVNTIRFLSVDGVEKANSGHPGMPMGMASIAHVLWSQFLKFNPKNPNWVNRDRFILSNGHGSMLLYSMLHLTGYDLPLEQLKNFRQWHSQTPGHPELGDTPGVETTTGPLGQGIATAVGIAMGQKYLNSLFPTKGKALLDHRIYVFAGDGCMMEGISSEAASLAGHLGLGQIIILYDDNHISIEGNTDVSFSEDVPARFKSQGWNVLKVKDGHNLDLLKAAIQSAQKETTKPTLIAIQTTIGYGSPNKANTGEVHGSPLGKEEIALTKKNLGWQSESDFYIPEEVSQFYSKSILKGEKCEEEWNKRFKEWSIKNPELKKLWDRLDSQKLPQGWEAKLPDFAAEEKMATRAASGKVINAIAPIFPELLGGSADLAPSNNTNMKGISSFNKKSAGRNLHFGVREHAMAAAMNGMSLSKKLIPYGGTFFNFTDYMKGAMRLSALMKLQMIYVLTHDSIGLGEDGPTHQPIEQLAHMRAIPNVVTIRPADAIETAAAWKFAIEHRHGPTLLVLTRQNLPVLHKSKYPLAGQVEKGGYILTDANSGKPDLILIATGSEVSLALSAQTKLENEGIATRVVSLPSWELFEQQEAAYRESVLPKNIKARVSIECLSGFGWERYVGTEGAIIGMKTFGASAPANILMEKFGFSVDNVVNTSKRVLDQLKETVQ
ncbi:MAG: transketolase [Elusimicrobiota bacterium]